MLTKEDKEEVNKIQNKLLSQEKVECVARQSQYTNGGSVIPSIVFVTSHRIIEKKSYPIKPKFDFYEYNNIFSAKVKKGIIKSSIVLVLPGEEHYFDAIDKDKAVYATDFINDHLKKVSAKNGYQRFRNSASVPIRKGFSEKTKETVLRRQNHRCSDCKKLSTTLDFDHIDGDRSNNSQANCQALCPNCHAYKTRTLF